MAPTEKSPINGTPAAAQPTMNLATMLRQMLAVSEKVSDLIFSPARPPQIELVGKLQPVSIPGIEQLSPAQTSSIASLIIGNQEAAVANLEKSGSADLSFSVPGPTGSGKSSTLAAVIDFINETKFYHIVTIEDPIEFLHTHKNSTIHQRELHSDTPNFAVALRAALRQAPKVILVGEMRDRETMEVALEAAETGHLVLSTLHTIDAAKTVERIIGVFPKNEERSIRTRLSQTFRYIISQRRVPMAPGASPLSRF